MNNARYFAYTSRLLRLSFDKLKRDGISAFLQACYRKALGVLKRQDLSADLVFDQGLGTDTAGIIPIWKMDVGSAAKKHGNRYQASDPIILRELFSELPIDPNDFTFIDLGSGKGRALLLASMAGFREAIGVEFSKNLFDISNSNILLYRKNYPNHPPVECVLQDAMEFQFPDSDLVIYLYNPFGEAALQTVINNIRDAQLRYKREIYVLYFNNEHDELLSQNDGFHLIRELRNASVYKCYLSKSE